MKLIFARAEGTSCQKSFVDASTMVEFTAKWKEGEETKGFIVVIRR